MDQILISGLKVPCQIGWGDEERSKVQTIVLDITCFCETLYVCDDDLSSTIDYDSIRSKVLELAKSKTRKLLETLCIDIIQMIFCEFLLAQNISITAKKHFFSDCDFVGVTISRNRSDLRTLK